MSNRVLLEIKSSEPLATLNEILSDSSTRPRDFANKVINFFRALKGGAKAGAVDLRVCSGAAVSASMTGTFAGAPTALDVLSINGVTITFIAGASPANNEVSLAGAPSNSVLAARLAAAINASTTAALSGVVSASSLAAVVTVSCNVAGVIGNSIPLTDAATNFAFTGAATLLAGGSGAIAAPTAIQFS